MKIELYLNSEEYAAKGGTGHYMRSFRGQESTAYDDQLRLKQMFIELPEDIVNLKNMLEKIASQHTIEIMVYDRTRIRDTIRAFFKGVRKTPAVIIGKHRLTGNITEEQVTKAVKDQTKV
ncbi:MAG: hypothetical protein Q7J68_03840 [Thermoplasmata archaeon]|nr:hypothetical protein [Thermoplasmata archaeon]